eukprot:3713420-Rhodomonas_salina.1
MSSRTRPVESTGSSTLPPCRPYPKSVLALVRAYRAGSPIRHCQYLHSQEASPTRHCQYWRAYEGPRPIRRYQYWRVD